MFCVVLMVCLMAATVGRFWQAEATWTTYSGHIRPLCAASSNPCQNGICRTDCDFSGGEYANNVNSCGQHCKCCRSGPANIGYGVPLRQPEWSSAKDACIKENNHDIIDNVTSLGECQSLCEAQSTSFRCSSLEYYRKDSRCVLSAATSYSRPNDYLQPCPVSGWTFKEINAGTPPGPPTDAREVVTQTVYSTVVITSTTNIYSTNVIWVTSSTCPDFPIGTTVNHIPVLAFQKVRPAFATTTVPVMNYN